MKKTILLLSFLAFAASAQLVDSDFDRTDIATGLDTPWEILWGPDNKIWFTERKGTVKRVDPTTKQIETLLTIPAADIVENSETGLLGMALHPDFTTTKPWVYLVYTYPKQSATNGIVEKLVRYTYQNNQLVSPQILLDNILGNTTHVGSRLFFLPDKTLLMSTGEAQNQILAQNTSSLNGKILRLTETGGVPSDNPISGSLVYSFGHRNPQGITYGNGKIYSSEHGANDEDEINIIEPNRNYGWPTVQGPCNGSEVNFCTTNNVKEPIWSSGTGTEAIAGLDYYPANGAVLPLQNTLLLVTLKIGTTRGRDLRVFKLNTDGSAINGPETILFNNVYGRLRDITISPVGDVYISTSNKDGRGTPGTNDDRIIQLKYKTITSSHDESSQAINHIYPNPVKDILNISNMDGQKISLVNVNGAAKYVFEVNDGSIDLELVPCGVYYLMNTQNKVIRKIVKM